jgi:CheY-like chemotaxis protein
MAKKILIVEDYPATSEMMASLMKMEGFEATIAADGLAGVKAANSWQPDLILLDIMLPEMDGFEVCEQLKKNPETMKIPVIIVSVRAADDSIRKGKASGAVDYVPKPFDPFKLIELVKKYLPA